MTCTSVLHVNIAVFPGLKLCFDEMCLEAQFLIHSVSKTLFVIQPTCFSISIEPLCFRFWWRNNSVHWNHNYFTLPRPLLLVLWRVSLWWMALEKTNKKDRWILQEPYGPTFGKCHRTSLYSHTVQNCLVPITSCFVALQMKWLQCDWNSWYILNHLTKGQV